MRYVEKAILLQTLDHDWREHIVNLDHLRQYVGLRGYGQRDPLNEYKGEAFELFESLLVQLRSDVVRQLMHIQIQPSAPPLDRPVAARKCAPSISIRSRARTRSADRHSRVRRGPSRGCATGCRSQRPANLGQGAAQRALPVRIGPEIQALPRCPGLIR